MNKKKDEWKWYISNFSGKKEEAGCFFDGWLFKEKEGGK